MKRPTLGEIMEQDRMLVILRLLRVPIGYELSDLLLLRALDASGHQGNYPRESDAIWSGSKKRSWSRQRSFPAESSPLPSRDSARTFPGGRQSYRESRVRLQRSDEDAAALQSFASSTRCPRGYC